MSCASAGDAAANAPRTIPIKMVKIRIIKNRRPSDTALVSLPGAKKPRVMDPGLVGKIASCSLPDLQRQLHLRPDEDRIVAAGEDAELRLVARRAVREPTGIDGHLQAVAV